MSGQIEAGGGFAATLYEKLPIPVLILDEEARLVSCNADAGRAFGWNGHADGRVLDGETDGLLARRAAGGAARILRLRHADGSVFEAAAQVIALGQRPAAYALLLPGLSEGNYSDAPLCQRINAALDSVPEGFAVFDGEEQLVMFNRTFRERCGEARETVRIGATLEEIVRANLRAGVYRGIHEGTPDAEEFVQARLGEHRNAGAPGIVVPYGADRWMRSESHATATGDVAALRVDVTGLKRIQAALEEKRREYLSLLQILPDMIMRFDDRLVIRFINDKYAARFGMTSEQMTGMCLRSLARTPAQLQTLDGVLESSPDEPIRTRELRYEGADGSEHWVLWTSVATYDDRGRVSEVVAVGRDITEVKRQHRKLEAQALELKKKNEALSQFTATVSHDLKAPLRHLSTFAEMIGEDVRRGVFEDVPDYAEQLRKSAVRMRRIVDSLLEYAQIAWHIAERRPVSLADVVRDALALLESHVKESAAAIEVGALPTVMGDAELLRRLAQNLIGNAIKYCRPGTPPCVRVYGREDGDCVRFIVEDEGIGIDRQHVERIFDVFSRLHRDESVYPGTGVGLALARRIAESHDGTITVDTDYGPGARFVVTFPRL